MLSYCFAGALQIVKDYERAVILRLGRLVSKKAKGPGLITSFIYRFVQEVCVSLQVFSLSFPALMMSG
jgi:hypothetical protein